MTSACQFGWNRLKFELEVPRSLVKIFHKNHFQVHTIMFNQRSSKSFARINTQKQTVITAVLAHLESGLRNLKKIKKMKILRILSFNVTQFPLEPMNLEYCNYFKKVSSEVTFDVRSCMAFKEDELGHDLHNRIVCYNVPIQCTCVYLAMTNNVSKGSFHLL